MTTKAEEAKHRAQLDVARGKAIKAERDEAKLKVGDRVPKPEVRPERRIGQRITVVAVEAELPYTGCICCGALLGAERSLKHRAGCLYLAYTRAQQMADHYQGRTEQLELAMRDIRDIERSVAKRRSMTHREA